MKNIRLVKLYIHISSSPALRRSLRWVVVKNYNRWRLVYVLGEVVMVYGPCERGLKKSVKSLRWDNKRMYRRLKG